MVVADGRVTRVSRHRPGRSVRRAPVLQFAARVPPCCGSTITVAARLCRQAVPRGDRVEKAYLIHLLQEMIEAGVPMANADTPGNYMEVDTQEDFELAQLAGRGMTCILFRPRRRLHAALGLVRNLINDRPSLARGLRNRDGCAVRYIVAAGARRC